MEIPLNVVVHLVAFGEWKHNELTHLISTQLPGCHQPPCVMSPQEGKPSQAHLQNPCSCTSILRVRLKSQESQSVNKEPMDNQVDTSRCFVKQKANT